MRYAEASKVARAITEADAGSMVAKVALTTFSGMGDVSSRCWPMEYRAVACARYGLPCTAVDHEVWRRAVDIASAA